MIHMKSGSKIETTLTQQVEWYLGEYLNKSMVNLTHKQWCKLNLEYTVKTLLDIEKLVLLHSYLSRINTCHHYSLDKNFNLEVTKINNYLLHWFNINVESKTSSTQLYTHYSNNGGTMSHIKFSKELKLINPCVKAIRMMVNGHQVRGFNGLEIK